MKKKTIYYLKVLNQIEKFRKNNKNWMDVLKGLHSSL